MEEKTRKIDKVVEYIYFGYSIFFVIYLLRYLFTGAGGPTLLAVILIPVAYSIVTLSQLRNNKFYPGLPEILKYSMAFIFIILSTTSSIYMYNNFDAIRIIRLGIWNNVDYFFGTVPVILILEYSFRKYLPIFIVNIALLIYAAYGYFVPGMFYHPGLRWTRIIQTMSLEMSTGIYAQLPQLGLTLIISFIMVLGFLRGFGCIDSIMKWASKIGTRSIHALPQAAVLGSFAVATISGSGPANAATTGAVTIPALKQAGFPAVHAAAIETASSLGGQLMPPVMGITAFIMVEFLGVSYFDVIARGFGPAIIYFVGVSLAVYLLTIQFESKSDFGDETVDMLGDSEIKLVDKANLFAFATVIIALIVLMGLYRMPAMVAAVRVLVGLVIFLTIVFVMQNYKTFNSLQGIKGFFKPYLKSIDTLSTLGADLAVLLSLLGILAGSLTVTGIPTKVGALLVQAADFHVAAVVFVAFLFGYLLGMGLPPSPVYIMVALAVAPTMIRLGLHRWSVHFFAFFIGVFGHLSPPTSLTAVVTSKIADSDYTRTIIQSLQYCLPLLVLMFAVFTRPDMVVEVGRLQLQAVIVVMIGTIGLTFALHSKYLFNKKFDILLRALVFLVSGAVIFYPDMTIAYIMIVPTLGFIGYGAYLSINGTLKNIAEYRRGEKALKKAKGSS